MGKYFEKQAVGLLAGLAARGLARLAVSTVGKALGRRAIVAAARGVAQKGVARYVGGAVARQTVREVKGAGKFMRNPIAGMKNYVTGFRQAGTFGKAMKGADAYLIGEPLLRGRPLEAASWAVAPTAMMTKSVIDVGATGTKKLLTRPKPKMTQNYL